MDSSFERLRQVIADLRGENGCSWDRKQTHGSLIPYLEEETREAVEGIHIWEQTKDADNMCEELGDVLFQVMLHSQIAQEEGLFTIDDVMDGLSEKMIRRHPHVFGSARGGDLDGDAKSWDEIKKIEKEEKLAKKNMKSV